MKSAMFGVTQQDAPESIIACNVYLEHALVAIMPHIMIAILRSLFFCEVDRCCKGRSSVLLEIVSCWYIRGMLGGVVRKCVRWKARSSIRTSEL
jgi:hypothetical protein